ncbi:MAG: group II intron reverse transcriptase/maturase, partial [Gammaproteobacteria bacterium]
SRRNLYRKLVKRGISRRQAANAVFSNRQRWALSNTFAVTKAYPNRWFIQDLGQAIRSDQTLPHWFDLARWIRLP